MADDNRDEVGTAFLEQLNRAIERLCEEYEAAGVADALPHRYRDFLITGEYGKYANSSRDFYDNPHRFKFTDGYLISHFATSETYDGLFELFDEDADKALAFRPFTQLWDGPGKSSSIALFIDLSRPECAIQRLDEGQLYRVADSLDEFLGSLREER